MKTSIAESLHLALVDDKIQLKHLDVDSYMKTIKLMKKLSTFLQERADGIKTLAQDYNKEFLALTKTEQYKTAAKKNKSKEALTPEEETLLAQKAPVQFYPNGTVSGPEDFIEKVNAIHDRDFKIDKKELNYITDSKVFKALVENISTNNQRVLYEHLFKD